VVNVKQRTAVKCSGGIAVGGRVAGNAGRRWVRGPFREQVCGQQRSLVHRPVPRPGLGPERGLDRRPLPTPERSEEQGLVREREQRPEQMLFRATGQGLERRPLRGPEPVPERGPERMSLQEPERRLQRAPVRGRDRGQGLPRPSGERAFAGTKSRCKGHNAKCEMMEVSDGKGLRDHRRTMDERPTYCHDSEPCFLPYQ
jgi:hypothetical protein